MVAFDAVSIFLFTPDVASQQLNYVVEAAGGESICALFASISKTT